MRLIKNIKNRHFLVLALYFILAVLLAVFLHSFLRKHSIHEIVADLNGIPAYKKAAALVLTSLSFFILSFYDFLGLKYAGAKVGKKQVMLASFISYAFGNSIGLSVLASGSVRYRYYSACGLSFGDISKVIIFTTATLWGGLVTLSGITFAVHSPLLSFPFINLRYAGVVLLLASAAYIFMLFRYREPFSIYSMPVSLPSPSLGVMQIFVGCADWLCVSAVLYVLLPDSANIGYFSFLSIFMLAQAAALISHVPGGVLVFETVLLSFLPPESSGAAIGALLVFRITYYILPLLAAACLVGFSEVLRLKSAMAKPILFAGRMYNAVTPMLMAAVVFIGGAYLLFSGATPVNPDRLPFLAKIIPLSLMESSHFLASLAGMGLIILSRGLLKKIDLAYQLTLILLTVGAVLSLFKGAEVETFALQGVIIFALFPTRGLYNKKSSFISEVLTKEWFFTILVIFLVFTWLGFFSYKHVEYRSELWWTFTFDDQAPRFLRAMVGLFTLIAVLAAFKLIQPSKPAFVPYTDDINKLIEPVVAKSDDTTAYLAYLPDKQYLFGEDGKSFIMYGTEGRSFISMGDPVGPEELAAELVFRFRKMSEEHGCRAVFYEVGADYIPHYLDAGLKIFKIGEQARVKLADFSLEGSHWSGMRNTIKKAEKEGCSLRIFSKEEVLPLLPVFRQLSDEWMQTKNSREKRFSLGCFSEDYLMRMPFAAVMRDNKPVAFANLWMTDSKHELSIDLMRYGNDAPKGIMEYLFIKLIIHAKEEEYEFFNLGMAPLSGFELHSFSPFWNRLAGIMFKHGERFYNFKGLRSYKEKFKPQWEPRYIAVQSIFSLPSALKSIASLISGGASGIFSK
ncbi:bifunctional lysylphosphatidylglycerol flippase/synthetase MprF [Geovibrio thiophilus]|nr:bifunctional lysylphosphatidylglycerol flippase/synthetase MprF [Geovibrio thiophilus]